MNAILPPATSSEYDQLLLDLLPRQGGWTEEAYLWLTDGTNRLVEFTDGYLEPLPMPTDRHNTILGFFYVAFLAYLTPVGGKVQPAGVRLRIRPEKYREPDVLLLMDAKDPRRQNRMWTGADLVVEVVSEDRPDRDLVEKRADYAEGGVPEYWVANPLDETVTVLRLEGAAYAEHGVFRRGQTATAATLPGFAVDVAAVFDAD